MARRISTKIAASIFWVLALAVASTTAALVSAWQIRSILIGTINDNLPSFQAADDLEVALLEQRGFVSSFILDDANPVWIEELEKRKPTFDECYARARETALVPEEFAILDELLQAYRRYDAKRDEVVRAATEGDADRARRMLFRDLLPLHQEADRLSKVFKSTNVRIMNEATTAAAARARRDTLIVAATVLLTFLAGGALAWQFIVGVLRPVRRMLVEARGFEPDPPPADVADNELHAVGAYLRLLMSRVSDARSTLEQSRLALSNAEKLASVGKLASSVAHEIRNPLTALTMWLYWIREQVPASAELNDAFDVVESEVARLEGIVRNFLEFSRPPELKLQACDVRETVELTLHLIEPRLRESRIELLQRYDGGLPRVQFDPQQLKQVLINLLDHAIQATQPGGTLEISIVGECDRTGNQAIVLRVHDSGPGVPPQVVQRIFEPFFTTKPSGTGLGLCIAASIMARHGGRLTLEPSAAGACFAVSIPLAGVHPTIARVTASSPGVAAPAVPVAFEHSYSTEMR